VEPDVMLLDEPFAALDARLRQSVRGEVHDILRRAGTTAILVTHDQDEALSLADMVAVVRDGRVAQTAAPRALYGSPGDVETALFVGEANLLEATRDGNLVRTPLGSAHVAEEGHFGLPVGPVLALVRPEQIRLLPREEPSGLRGRIVKITYHGAYAMVRVAPDAADQGEAITVRTVGAPAQREGDEVRLGMMATSVEVLPRPQRSVPSRAGD
jgi:iron(III) transport system ATP-binding protein